MFNNAILMASAAAAAGGGGFVVDNSVLFNDDDSPRLYRTPTTAGNRLEGSISLWYKRCNTGSIMQLFNAGAGDDITFNASDKLTFTDSSGVSYITTQVFRDTTAWGHLLFAWDTTLATAGDRLRIYHNGVEITAFDTETDPAQFDLLEISNTVRQTIGANESNTEEFDGYLSQFYLVDGAQLTPTSFGEFNANGVWRPKAYSATTTTPAVSHVSNDSTGVNATTFTFSSQALGAAASDRRIVVCVGFQGGGSAAGATGVTVGGVTATRIVQSAANSETICSMWWAEVPTGTTGDVVITAGASKGNCGVSCYRLTGADTILSTDSDSAAGSGAASTGTVGSTGNSVVVGQLYLYGTALRTTTWSGLTEDMDAETEGYGVSQSTASDVITAASVAVSATPSGASYTEVFTLASFGSSEYGVNGFFLDFADSGEFGLYGTGANVLTDHPSAEADYIGDVSDFTFSGDDIVGANDKEIHLPGFFVGDCEFEFTIASGSDYGAIGFFDATEVGTIASSGGVAGMNSMTNSWYFEPDASLSMDVVYGGSDQAGYTFSEPSTQKMTREGAVFKVYLGGVLQHTYTQEFSGPVGLAIGGHSSQNWDDIKWSADNYGQFISSGLTTTDQVTDTPTNNFATFIDVGSGVTLSEGNLKITTSGTGWKTFPASLRIPKTGKWVYKVTSTSNTVISPGVLGQSQTQDGLGAEYPLLKPWGANAIAASHMSSNFVTLYWGYTELTKEINGTATTETVAALTTSDVLEVYLDNDNNTVKVYKNGVQLGSDVTGLMNMQYAFVQIYYSGVSVEFDFGQHGFTRTDDTYNYLSTANFPTPAILDPTKYFQTTLYMGTGAIQTIGQADSNSYFNEYGSGDRTSIITAGAVGGSYNPAAGSNLINGNKTDGSGITSYATDQYFFFEFNEAVNITEVTIFTQSPYSGYNLGSAWIWEGSNDDWTTTTALSSAIDMSSNDVIEVHTLNLIGSTDTYSYYRIRNSNGSGVNSNFWEEFEFKVGATRSSLTRSTFQPDWVWLKNRSQADGHMLIDAPRGVTKEISSDSTAKESTDANGLTAFTSSGFTLGTGAGGYNDVGESFVAWQWLAGGGAGSSNTTGSINTITTTVNTTAGISISTFTGSGVSGDTIGHGLGAIPKMILLKKTANYDTQWTVYHAGNTSAPATEFMVLNASNATSDYLGAWNDTLPSSTLITLGNDSVTNESAMTYVVYAFAEVEGFSCLSSYVGNGAASLGTPVFCGFKPAYVMIKKASSTGNWVIYDSARSPYNEADDQLLANTTAAETTGSEEIDFLATGFRVRASDSDINSSNGFYVYAAFASNPFGATDVPPATTF